MSPGRVVPRVWAGGTPGAAPGRGCCARVKGEELQDGGVRPLRAVTG